MTGTDPGRNQWITTKRLKGRQGGSRPSPPAQMTVAEETPFPEA